MTSSVPSVEDFMNAFPNQLTPIVGEPTYATLKTLKDQLNANAASVPTTLGGRNNGYLGLTLSPAAYATISPTAFIKPAYPGQHPAIPAGTNAANTSAIIRRHTEDTRQLCVRVQKCLYRSQEPTSQCRRRHLRPSPSRLSCWLHESINLQPPHASF